MATLELHRGRRHGRARACSPAAAATNRRPPTTEGRAADLRTRLDALIGGARSSWPRRRSAGRPWPGGPDEATAYGEPGQPPAGAELGGPGGHPPSAPGAQNGFDGVWTNARQPPGPVTPAPSPGRSGSPRDPGPRRGADRRVRRPVSRASWPARRAPPRDSLGRPGPARDAADMGARGPRPSRRGDWPSAYAAERRAYAQAQDDRRRAGRRDGQEAGLRSCLAPRAGAAVDLRVALDQLLQGALVPGDRRHGRRARRPGRTKLRAPPSGAPRRQRRRPGAAPSRAAGGAAAQARFEQLWNVFDAHLVEYATARRRGTTGRRRTGAASGLAGGSVPELAGACCRSSRGLPGRRAGRRAAGTRFQVTRDVVDLQSGARARGPRAQAGTARRPSAPGPLGDTVGRRHRAPGCRRDF